MIFLLFLTNQIRILVMKTTILRECLRIATTKLTENINTYRHWSFVVQNNKIVEWGMNCSAGDAPLQLGYSPHSRLHSELVAYKRAKGLIGKKKFDMINVRFSKRGEWRMAKPCEVCWGWLQEVGCKKVWWTTEGGWDNG